MPMSEIRTALKNKVFTFKILLIFLFAFIHFLLSACSAKISLGKAGCAGYSLLLCYFYCLFQRFPTEFRGNRRFSNFFCPDRAVIFNGKDGRV